MSLPSIPSTQPSIPSTQPLIPSTGPGFGGLWSTPIPMQPRNICWFPPFVFDGDDVVLCDTYRAGLYCSERGYVFCHIVCLFGVSFVHRDLLKYNMVLNKSKNLTTRDSSGNTTLPWLCRRRRYLHALWLHDQCPQQAAQEEIQQAVGTRAGRGHAHCSATACWVSDGQSEFGPSISLFAFIGEGHNQVF